MGKHAKLIEALAVFFALGAWALDWWSLQGLSRLESELNSSIGAISHNYTSQYLSAEISLESAVTRYSSLGNAHGDDELGIWESAWESPVVRLRWLDRVAATTAYIKYLLLAVEGIEAEAGLGSSDAIRARQVELDRLNSDSNQRLLPISPAIPNKFIPDVKLMPGPEAALLAKRIDDQLAATVSVMNQSVLQLRGKVRRRSLIYRSVFAFGSILLILGKIIEWYFNLRSKTAALPVKSTKNQKTARAKKGRPTQGLKRTPGGTA